MEIKVIDISNHNGTIDWDKVTADGIGGVMIRAGYGWDFETDERFYENVKACERLGLPWGAYCYSYACTMDQAKVEVEGFIGAIKHLKPTLPVVIDTEDADGYRRRNGDPSWALLREMAEYQLGALEEAGFYAMYYASAHWTRQMGIADRFDLWLAHWDVDAPSMPCGIWQYTENGPRYGDGIGTSDLNIMYIDYPKVIKAAGRNGWGASAQMAKSASRVEKLEEDGYLGRKTITALQRHFGTPADGTITEPSQLVLALQKWLGVAQDGYWGKITTSALQRRMGTVVDGVIDSPSPCIKELQRRLNAGNLK